MKKRYKKIVYEDERGNIFEANALEKYMFEASEGTKGELIIRAESVSVSNDNLKKEELYSENYMDPIVPKGYTHVLGEWNNGFVIERCSDGSQLVWVPVGNLISDGTVGGIYFSRKFGRRNYYEEDFSKNGFDEPLSSEFLEQIESVEKYGGFYISCYNISKSPEGKPQSVKGALPWVDISFNEAKKLAATFEDNDFIKSHLTFGAEYDSVVKWIIETNAKTVEDMVRDSTNWGNYLNTENSPERLVQTGSCEDWKINNIYDFAGNVEEWTQEVFKKVYHVSRGGSYYDDGNSYPAFWRAAKYPVNLNECLGFRVVLCIK